MNSTKEIFPAQVNKNMQPEEFDLVILGGGTRSTVAAWTFAGEGKRVAVIDRKYIGGSCPNIACLPRTEVLDLRPLLGESGPHRAALARRRLRSQTHCWRLFSRILSTWWVDDDWQQNRHCHHSRDHVQRRGVATGGLTHVLQCRAAQTHWRSSRPSASSHKSVLHSSDRSNLR